MSFIESLSAQAVAELTEFVAHLLSSPRQIAAHTAAAVGVALIVAGAFTRTMRPLRWLAVGSNVGLLIFGMLSPAPVTLAIAAALLPINLFRAIEVTRLTRRVSRAELAAGLAGLWLRPYMKARRLKTGQTLFSKGDPADRLFLLVEGHMELAEIGQPLTAGRIFGEVALFSPNHVRTHTVLCLTPCVVLEIHESTVKQLYYQHPSFGFHLIELLASRLSSDVERAEQRAATAAAPVHGATAVPVMAASVRQQ
jgi:hypothetical protein